MNKPNLKIINVPISLLKSSDYNPRTWDEKEISDLTKSIKKYGIVDPILANAAAGRKNIVIGGHFRLQVAKDLGYKEIPVVYINIPDIAREKELNLRLNKNQGRWNFELLANFNQDLLLDIGFESPELDKIFQVDVSEKDDIIPEIKKTNIKLGDIFQLGKHRLLCADCTKKENIEKLMQGEKADMVFTDPPYGVEYDGGTTKRNILIGDKNTGLYLPALKNIYEFSKDKMALYLWFAGLKSKAVFEAVFEIRSLIIWNKNQAQYGSLSAQYKPKHESLLYCYKKGKSPNWYGGTKEITVWDIARTSKNEYHPTQKPVALAERAIRNSSKRGQNIIDLFGGSGSTMIASHKAGRYCFMCEIEPLYCQVIIDRWQNFTRQKAVKING